MVLNLTQTPRSTQDRATDLSLLKQAFQSIHAESCPYFYNFHIHTTCSDGKLEPLEVIEQAIAIGLKGFAITDHHTVKGYQIVKSSLEDLHQRHNCHHPLPHLWTGVEINAQLLNTEVHILGYAFNPEHAQMKVYLQGKSPKGEAAEAVNAIAAIHEAGGLAVLAHPARYRRSAAQLIPEAALYGIDGIETYYAYNNPFPWHPSPEQTRQVQALSAAYKLFDTCGTDTHGSSLLQRL